MLAELLLDYGIPLTLVAVLAALIRFRQIMIELDEHGYHFITSGLGFLALAVVLRLYHQADMLVRVPFLSEPMFYRLLFWSAITAGTGLLVSGLASHLPAIRTVRREANRKMAGLELIRTIERLSAVEPRTDVLVRSTLGHISSAMSGSVEITSRPPSGTRASDSDNTLTLVLDKSERSSKLLKIYSNHPLSPDDRLNLSVVAEILAQRLERDRILSQHALVCDFNTLRRNLLEVASESGSLSRSLSLLMISLREQFDLDQMTTCLIDNATGRMSRLTVGRAGSLLTEKGMPIPDEVADRLAGSEVTQSSTPPSLKSAVSICYRSTSNRAILLSLVSGDSRLVEQISPDSWLRVRDIIAEIVVLIRQRREIRRRNLRDSKLAVVAGQILGCASVESMSAQLGRLLGRELGVDTVRIATIDASPTFMTTFFAMTDERIEIDALGRSVLLSSVPVHHSVIRSGRTRVFSANSILHAVEETEAKAMLVCPPGATLIVPIRNKDGVVGTLSCSRSFAHRRSDFSQSDRRFAHQAALLFSQLLAGERQKGDAPSWSVIHTSDRQLRSRLKSSLSGILGSLELIRSVEENNGDVKPYLKIIGTSARRINDYLTIGATTDRQSSPEQEDEQ
ncbi:MAG: hypothetical protein NDJ18_01390 [candidate division Zixibacteria bacterium]|nr:hypothetical protein [candidate division Zixibacteria bacterium]